MFFSDSEAPHLATQWTMGIWVTDTHYTLALCVGTLCRWPQWTPCFGVPIISFLGCNHLIVLSAVLTKAKATQDPRKQMRGTFRVPHPTIKKTLFKHHLSVYIISHHYGNPPKRKKIDRKLLNLPLNITKLWTPSIIFELLWPDITFFILYQYQSLGQFYGWAPSSQTPRECF